MVRIGPCGQTAAALVCASTRTYRGPPRLEGNELTELLEVAAHGMTAILATWLGLLVLTRAARTRGAPIFSSLCLLLVCWSVAIIVQRIGTDPGVRPAVNVFEDVPAFLLPAVTLHIALAIAVEGRRSTLATTLLLGGYLLGALAGLQATVDPAHPIGFSGPSFAPFGLPDRAVAWAFALARGALFAAGIAYLLVGLREAGADRARRRQVQFALATVVLGVVGGMARILPEEIGGPPWIGVTIVAFAIVMAAYAVVAQHVFVAADVAERAVRGSVLAGLAIVVYVGTLVIVESLVATTLSINFPIVTALAVIVTLALFDPVSDLVRRWTGGTPRQDDEKRLLMALGNDPFLAQGPEQAVEPVLARLVRTFELVGACVVDADGAVRASIGRLDPSDPLTVRLTLGDEARPHGAAIFGPKRSGLAFLPSELPALQLAATFLGSSLQLADRQDQQTGEIGRLRAERAIVESRGSALREALDEAATPPRGLHVHALGPLRAERDGEPVRRWGGEKAGSRQAEAIFAFIFDRGERGVSKDEILELVWPDVDLDRADVAFHRTMLGLRTTLQQGRRARGSAGPIVFHNDRYRLDPEVVAWSDVGEFQRLLEEVNRGGAAGQLDALEQARALYRGDYLDDCPFYGDSAQVEERRTDMRRRYVDLLVDLGELHARRGARGAAAACLRQAETLAEDDLPRITEALRRLDLVSLDPA